MSICSDICPSPKEPRRMSFELSQNGFNIVAVAPFRTAPNSTICVSSVSGGSGHGS